jgi:putative membrane protein
MLMNSLRIHDFLQNNTKKVIVFFIIFYSVGILGMLSTMLYPLFLKLIPFALLLSAGALLLFHDHKFTFKSIIIFISIFILGFVIEVIGVNMHLIFGHYNYGNSLGFKLFNTPVIIGINWFILVYASASVIEKFRIHAVLKIIISSGIMLFYDLILEQVAPKLDMWIWFNNEIPFKNYLAWFVIALGFHSIIKMGKIESKNRLAFIILTCQFTFFIVLYLFLK